MKPSHVVVIGLVGGAAVALWDGNTSLAALLAAGVAVALLTKGAAVLVRPDDEPTPARGRRPGFCHRCGYSLTGNVSGVCPECGTPTRGTLPARGSRG